MLYVIVKDNKIFEESSFSSESEALFFSNCVPDGKVMTLQDYLTSNYGNYTINSIKAEKVMNNDGT